MNDHGYSPLSKYSSARDSILHYMCINEWANASFGDVESPTGYVWRISNKWVDVSFDNNEFNSVIEEWFTWNSEVTDSWDLRNELVGHFLITEDTNGLVYVTECPTESDLTKGFESLARLFNEWNNEDEGN